MGHAQQLRKPKTSDRIAAAYFGTQSLDHFSTPCRQAALDSPQYVDVTAGTGRTLFSLAQKGIPVVGNDRCFYAYCAMSSVLELGDWDEDNFDERADQLHPSSVRWTNGGGVCSSRLGTRQGPYTSPETAHYIDTLCIRNQHDQLVLASVGRALATMFTFRTVGWARISTLLIDSTSITPERMWRQVMSAVWRTLMFQKSLKTTDNQVLYGDAKAVPSRTAVRSGAYFFANPAWPWATDLAGKNPYRFFTYDLSEVLLQKPIDPIAFWERGDDERILSDVQAWFEHAMLAGAARFCLSTQSTNAPDPLWVYKQLAKTWEPEWVGYVTRPSKQSHGDFRDWFGQYRLQ